jgi:hypothetical protein
MARGPQNPPAADGIEPVGAVRRSQLVSTYGIGAIVDLEKGSFMPMGLEDWEHATRLPSLMVNEPRLQSMLGVSHFRLAPIREEITGSTQVKARSAAPAVRFPEWHECPRCHRLGTENDPFEPAADGIRLQCIADRAPATPVRFVVACRRGHMSDFPWIWWAHRSRPEGICDNPSLWLSSRAQSASLGDLIVECRNCQTAGRRTSESMGSAFRTGAMQGAGCRGFRPWLHDTEVGCRETPLAIQRGASNVHFTVVCSALSIPPASEAASQIVIELMPVLRALPAEAIEGALRGYAGEFQIPVESLIGAWRHIVAAEGAPAALTERIARADEYNALSDNRDDQIVMGVVSQFMNTVAAPPPEMNEWFDLVGAVSRLREVRALAGFSRIDPFPVSADRVQQAITQGQISPLSKTPRNWLPAAEIRGEGIFLRFRTDGVDRWIAASTQVRERAQILEARSLAMATTRGYVRDYTVTPRLLLVHTFAHALIRQISIECGYSASALRERLYVAEATADLPAMNGVLIYTGSPDSEGSLGGLVRLAHPSLLEPIFHRTLRSAAWCGSDPVCLETDPNQPGDRISGAACHCCVLLPETACEKFNRELDRAVLTGAAEARIRGFFQRDGGDPWLS